MKKYSLYLFDFDGTLFDTLDSLKEAYRLSFLKYNISVTDDEYALFLSMSLPHAAEYKKLDEKYLNGFIDYFHSFSNSNEVYRKTKLYFDTIETIKYLESHNINYGIVTGSATYRVKGIYEHFGLDSTKIKVIVGNDSYIKPKPDPEPILNALKETNYFDKKNEVIFIGDALQDELCAKNANIDYIYVNRDKKHNKNSVESLLDIFK